MRCTVFFFLYLVSLVALGDVVHVSGFAEPTIFRSSNSLVYNHHVISGPVKHQDYESELYSEGYYKTDYVSFSGDRSRYIFDYNESYTVDYIMAGIKSSLSKQGYALNYECKSMGCGEPEAFASFLDDLVDANTTSYGYQLFKRNIDSSDLVSVYAVLIDQQVRVLFDIYHSRPTSLLIDLGRDAALGSTETGLMLFYETSETDVSPMQRSLVLDFLQLNHQKLNDGYLVVRGHSDHIGADDMNSYISKQRAEKVTAFLESESDINACPELYYGSSEPFMKSSEEKAGFSNRRVELVVVQTKEQCG